MPNENVNSYDQRRALETSLEIKRQQRQRYLEAAETLEATAYEYRQIASEISRGIGRTMKAINRIQRREKRHE